MTAPLVATAWTSAGDTSPLRTPATSPVPIDRRIAAVKAAGYSGMGLIADDLAAARDSIGFPRLRHILDDNGIEHIEIELIERWWIPDGDPGHSYDVRELLLAAADALAPRFIKIGSENGPPAADLSALIAPLRSLADEAADRGTRVAIEPMPFSRIDSVPMGADLVTAAAHPAVGLVVDAWHVFRAGTPLEELAAALSPEMIFGVELDDAAADVVGTLFEDTVERRLLCGQGCFDLPGLVQVLRDKGFDGPWGVEILSESFRARPVDPNEEAARSIGAPRSYTDPRDLIADPGVDAVAISSPAATHTDLVVAAAEAGKHVFCEKPMALTLADADRAIAAAERAGVALQVGFNRRFDTDFAAMHEAIATGAIGTPQLLRSLTRDPGISAEVAARVKPWTIFNETLIHDFDTLCWLNPGARVTTVYAQAAALIHPQYADAGFLDTSVVQLRFDNGAFATAEASFQAVYGYDVRGEVFGSDGVLLAGRDPGDAGRLNTELFADAYTAQFVHFIDSVRAGDTPLVTGHDARVALEIALATAESVRTGAPVALAEAVLA